MENKNIMKKIFFLLILIMVLMVVFGCKKNKKIQVIEDDVVEVVMESM